jgi:uncharacterized membrane protein YgcG
LFAPAPARAGYDAFASDIEVSSDGSFVVSETISGSFDVERHGIYRAVPVRYDTGHWTSKTVSIEVLDVTRDGHPEPYAAYREGGFLMVKVGSPDVTFAGPFVYGITYEVNRALSYGETEDTLLWNVTGHAWDDPFETVAANVTVDGAAADELSAACFTGPVGSTEQDCSVDRDGATVRLLSGDFLTASVAIPKGVVSEPSSFVRTWWWLADNAPSFLVLVPVGTAVWALRRWWLYGRDPKSRAVAAVEYGPPEGLSPAEVGTLVDVTFHDRDFAAAVVHLAVRGYVRISDEGGGDCALTRIRRDTDGLKPFEAALMEELFLEGDEVRTESQKKRFKKARDKAAELVHEEMSAGGYYEGNPQAVRSRYVVVGVLLAFASIMFSSTAYFLLPTGLILIVLGMVMPRRTAKGQEAFEHARGFKEFVSRAEKYRIQWQEKEGAFEAFLPYAMAFDVADKWTRALAVSPADTSGWYAGPSAAGMADFGAAMGSLGTSLGTASGPGSSGGGFSGGGFGGGGGGSW